MDLGINAGKVDSSRSGPSDSSRTQQRHAQIYSLQPYHWPVADKTMPQALRQCCAAKRATGIICETKSKLKLGL